MASTLRNRNVSVAGHRTSVRLEPAMWLALDEIAGVEGCTIHDLCGRVARSRSASSLTAGLRVFLLEYYRRLAIDAGRIEIRERAREAA